MRAAKRIAIVDYGMGNIGSVAHALETLGGSFFVSGQAEMLRGAEAFVLPGVGAFGAAMDSLNRLGLVDFLREQVVERRKPFLGICLGMQLLAEDSTELGFHRGLGWIAGHVVELQPQPGLRVPQVGWNAVEFGPDSSFFRLIGEGATFYFDHSYHLVCEQPLVAARCDYGGEVVAAIQRDHVFATQFHPEKSQRNGLKLLRNFLSFVESR